LRIFDFWQAKIGSVLLAIIFYVNLQNSKVLVKNINVPVEYPRLSGNLYYSKINEKTYQIRVEGFRDLVNYHSQFMKVVVDPSELNVGENQYEVKKVWGAPSSGIKITMLGPKLNIGVDVLASKSMPVDIGFEDDLPQGYVRSSYTIKPSAITVSGPKAVVEKMSKFVLPTISLKDATESFSRTVRIPEFQKSLGLVGNIKEFQLRVNIIRDLSNIGDQIIVQLPVKCEYLDPALEADLSVEEVSIKFSSTTKVNSIQVIQGIQASIPCNYIYDRKTKKISPNALPVLAKVRIVKSPELKNIEILGVMPEKINIQYKVKPGIIEKDKKETGSEEIFYPEELPEDKR
jgi:YbbR domain-containing protein